MARPGQGFPIVPDDVRGELRKVTPAVPDSALAASDDDDDDDDRDMPRSIALGSSRRALTDAMVRTAFGRDDEITRDFQIPRDVPPDPSALGSGVRPVRAEPAVPAAWRPLTDDDHGAAPEAEPLLDSLRRAQTVPEDKGGGGRPGLN
jgi:hypothetical protein